MRQMAGRLREAAMWIGRATAYANHCAVGALPAITHTENHGFIRDPEGMPMPEVHGCKRKTFSFEHEQALLCQLPVPGSVKWCCVVLTPEVVGLRRL